MLIWHGVESPVFLPWMRCLSVAGVGDFEFRQLDKNNHPKHSVLLPPRPSILPESSQVKYFSARITITG